MKTWQALLLPFSAVYRSVMGLRNTLYEKHLFSSTRFDLPVIVVGNLTVGGTGKTPHVAYLASFLKRQGLNPAIISRGYGRKSKGFRLADSMATADSIGDEPMTYFRQFPDLTVAVGEDRVNAINQVLTLNSEINLILLDDAYQHRAVQRNLNLLLTDYGRLFTRDQVLPAGLLRESRFGAVRADAVIVTKCPDSLQPEKQQAIAREITHYTQEGTPIFFTRYRYGQPVAIGKEIKINKNIILVTGIAQAHFLVDYLTSQDYNILQHLDFRDHHNYSEKDIAALRKSWEKAGPGTVIFTTSKDAVKLQQPEWEVQLRELPVYYIPVEVAFLDSETEFQRLVLAAARARGPEIT